MVLPEKNPMNSPVPEHTPTRQVRHVPPFIYEEADSKSLHFTINQLQSRMRTSRPNELQVDYTRTMMGFLLLHRQPKHIAMIGLGGGSLAKFCYQHLPGTQFTAVEINPHVIAMREEFLIPADDGRFRVIEADGAHFVRDTPGGIDVLLVDGYDHQGQPASLCSLAFYASCQRALATHGVLAINLDHTHPLHELFMERIDRTFGGNIVEVVVNHYGNVVVFAARELKLEPDSLRSAIHQWCANWVGWIAHHG